MKKKNQLALRAWRAGTTIYEIKDNNESSYSFMSDIKIEHKLIPIERVGMANEAIEQTVLFNLDLELYTQKNVDDYSQEFFLIDPQYNYIENQYFEKLINLEYTCYYEEIYKIREEHNVRNVDDTFINSYVNYILK